MWNDPALCFVIMAAMTTIHLLRSRNFQKSGKKKKTPPDAQNKTKNEILTNGTNDDDGLVGYDGSNRRERPSTPAKQVSSCFESVVGLMIDGAVVEDRWGTHL